MDYERTERDGTGRDGKGKGTVTGNRESSRDVEREWQANVAVNATNAYNSNKQCQCFWEFELIILLSPKQMLI